MEAERTSRPVLVEIMIDRAANASMGSALNTVVEFEPVS
jgi:tartronate-semialdehyde synthase